MPGHSRTVERAIGRIASRAHGIVTRAELLRAGVGKGQIDHRVATGALLPAFPGVYRVGHRAPSTEAGYMAAVKACGEGAVLSGPAAAHLLQLVRHAPSMPVVEAPTERRVKGIETRRTRNPDRRDRMTFNRIPVTTVARTLVDIAAQLDEDALARACHEAGVRYKTTPRQVEAVLRRRPTSPGAAKLRRVLRGDAHVTLSALEAKFLELLREANLPLPITNKPAGSKRVDCRWPEHRLTVELDSYRYHNTRHAWEQDRRREREAHARGDRHRRYTHMDVFDVPGEMLAELSALLRLQSKG